jgi:hypothetical protein
VVPTELSMMTPLAPPVTDAAAAVAVVVPQPIPVVMSKDMMQPVAAGQSICALVRALAATLTKILSVAPSKNSVIGEHAALAVVSCGPCTGVPIAPAVIGICQIVGTALPPPAEVPQTYRFPVPSTEL